MRRPSLLSLAVLLLATIIPTMFQGCSTTDIGQSEGIYGVNPAPHAFGRAANQPAIPGAQPAPDEELWIISKPSANDASNRDDDSAPGSGAMLAVQPDDKTIPLPLKHTDVKAAVHGYVATVDVTQQFHNPFSEKIEAVYVFPLPANAAVNQFVMIIGERKIRGLIRDRAEAEKIYNEARRQGYVASLLTQERPNIFTQKVANIEPGKQIDIAIRYFHTLSYDDGWYEFVFPMVVGPRYNPPGTTDGIGAAPRGGAGVSGQPTEVQYLHPTQRSGHDIALTLNIDAGVAIEEIACNSHRVAIQQPKPATAAISIDPADSLPNKDFVLRYRVAGDTVKSALLLQPDDRVPGGGFFTLMIVPPRDLQNIPRQPVEMLFLLDCSGSMSGQPLDRVKQAVTHALKAMKPTDSFQIVEFAYSAKRYSPAPILATAENLQQALRYVSSLKADGGTEMLNGVQAAIDAPRDPERPRLIALMTDGFIGNEDQIISHVAGSRDTIRFFSFGVGSAPNRYLIEGVAKAGAGALAYIGLHDDAGVVMDQYFQRVSHPALTDIKIDWAGLTVSEVFPRRIPELYVGRPVILTGKYTGKSTANLQITGKTASGDRAILKSEIRNSQFEIASSTPNLLPSVWARMKIADLTDQMIATKQWEDRELPAHIKRTALDYQLLSPYTAFLAVDASRRTEGDHGTTVPQPVPIPEGTRYDTNVPEK